jgi:hypothetical protein
MQNHTLLSYARFQEMLVESELRDAAWASWNTVNEGGAYGHLSHPFEDFNLTFADLKQMIETTVNGAFGPENFVQEKCVSGDSLVNLEHRGITRIDELVNHKYEDAIMSQDLLGNNMYQPILDWVNNGESEDWLEIETEDGKKILVTPNHRIFANGVDIKAEDLKVGDSLTVI